MRSFLRRCVLVLVLFLAAVLGCSLSHYWCREDDPHEWLMEKRVYMKGGIIFINEVEQHCEEQRVRVNSSKVARKKGSDVKVKASSKYLVVRTSQTAGLSLHAAHIQE